MRQGPPSGDPCPQAVRVSALSEAAASSGPNSVLTQPGVRALVPRTRRSGKRTGRALAGRLSE